MTDLQVVRFAPDVEIQRGGDGRTVHGILIPWDAPADVYDQFGPTGRPARYKEAAARGLFPDAVASPQRVKLLGHHNKHVAPLGRGQAMRDDTAGLYGELRVSKTVAGDDYLELVRDGVLDSFSVSFAPIESVLRGDVYYRTRASLTEVSIVTFPAYAGAVISGVRSQELPSADDLTPGAGEPPVTGGSGDLQATRTGMTPNERARAIALAQLPRSPQ